jgi:hypothetical protein
LAKDFIEDFNNYRRLLVKDIIKRHEEVINKYEAVRGLIQEICYPPIFEKEEEA